MALCSQAHMVLFSVTTVLALEVGTIKSLGVLLPALQEQFATYTWVIGLAISLIPGVGSFECLLVPSMRKSGIVKPGTTLIICGAVCGLGLIFGSLTTSIAGIVLTCVIQGPLIVAKVVAIGTLPDYFTETLDIATAVSSCGYSTGVMIMPVLTQLLLDIYGWRGAMMLLGAIIFHIVGCGALIRYVETYQHGGSGYILHKQIPTNDDDVSHAANEPQRSLFMSFVSNIINVSLLTNGRFVHVLIIASVMGYTTTGWLTYLIPHAEEKGISPYRAALIGTAGGFGNLVGKVCYPVLSKFRRVSSRLTVYIGCVICAVSLGVDPLLTEFGGLCVSSIVFAFTNGIQFVSVFILANEVVTDHPGGSMIDACAWYYMIYGITSMLGGFTSGLLFDVTGSYDTTFVALGASFILPLVALGVDEIYKLLH